jgi:hypothetical protein
MGAKSCQKGEMVGSMQLCNYDRYSHNKNYVTVNIGLRLLKSLVP